MATPEPIYYMVEIPDTLFSQSQRKELSANEIPKPDQVAAIKKWKNDLDSGILDVESHMKDWLRDFMIEALGYPREKIKAEQGEKNTRLDYSYTPDSGKGGVLFELKSRKKQLFQDQGYHTKGQDTPVDQAITYIEENPNIDYAIITNFERFVLITRQDLRSQCYSFTFPPKGSKLFDSEINEFVHFFSKDGIESGFVEKARKATIREEDTITKDFYKLYHQTRLMLIQAFNDKERIEYPDAIKITQTYLNRLIFLLFAEDNDLIKKRLFTDGILAILDAGNIKEKTRDVSSLIQTLFSYMDAGSNEIDNTHGFNGDFFKKPIDGNAYFYDFQTPGFFKDIFKNVIVPAKIKLNKENQIAVDRYNGKVSPIIINFLKIASYNFKHKDPNEISNDDSSEQISVNILGRIFEQSIGDLEELKTNQISQRKKEGVFYTPEYITEYICKHTIIPYLSKNDVTEPRQLILEYKDDIKKLEDKIDNIKILDPACGSGAFLVQSVDVLISIIDEIQNFKESQGKYAISKKGTKTKKNTTVTTFDKEFETDRARRKLIQNNIYGVDINPESVEITKLSLFLKIASKNEQLITLSERILVGNSIIDDDLLEPKKSFNWENEFLEVLHPEIGEKFDIVIGNPPYVRQELLSKFKEYLKKEYVTFSSSADIYTYFIERSLKNLKQKGRFGFIVSSQFTKSAYGLNLRNFLNSKTLEEFIYFGDLPVFTDATTYPCIMVVTNEKPKESHMLRYTRINTLNFNSLQYYISNNFELINQNALNDEEWQFISEKTNDVLNKIKSDSKQLVSFEKIELNRGILTGFNEAFIVDDETYSQIIKQDPKAKKIIRPILTGREVLRHHIKFKKTYIIFIPWDYDLEYSLPIKQHLLKFKDGLSERPEVKKDLFPWWSMSRYGSNYYHLFEKPKIIFRGLSLNGEFPYVEEPMYVNAPASFISGGTPYLSAILQSKLIWFYIIHNCPLISGGFRRLYNYKIEQIPIHNSIKKYEKDLSDLSLKLQKLSNEFYENTESFWNRIQSKFEPKKLNKKLESFLDLNFNSFLTELDKLSTIKIDNPTELETWEKYFNQKQTVLKKLSSEIEVIEEEIDSIVYEMYGLSNKEIKIIEKDVENNNS